HHQRHGGPHQPENADGGFRQVPVGSGKPPVFIIRPVESPHHPHARQQLPHDPVQPVDRVLQGAEQGHGFGGNEPDDQGQQRHYRDDHQGQDPVLRHGHDDAAHSHQRSADHEPHHHEDHLLHLGHIIGGAGDQRRGAQ